MRKRFGELLLEQGLISEQQLSDALAYQRRKDIRLGAALVARGHLTEAQLVNALGAALRVPVVDLTQLEPNPQAQALVSLSLASEQDLFPYSLRKERGRTVLTVATSDPMNFRMLDELEFMTNCKIEAVLARASDIDLAIRRHYGPRLAKPYRTEDVRLALEDDADGSEMTIYRRGGGVETVNTQTGSIPIPPPSSREGGQASPRTPRPRDESAVLLTEEVPDETPVSTRPTEVPIPLTQPKGPASGPPPLPPATPPGGSPGPARPAQPVATAPPSYGGGPPRTGTRSGMTPPIPATGSLHNYPPPPPVASPRPAPTSSTSVPVAPLTSGYRAVGGFDQALGALIEAASEADHAEAVLRLERKFWALMRVLAKKGVLTNEDFLAELGEEEKWRK